MDHPGRFAKSRNLGSQGGSAPAGFDASTFVRRTSGLYLILKPDLTIVDASEEYRLATLLWREAIAGCYMFDVFPDNPNNVSSAQGGGSKLHVLPAGVL